MITPGGSLFREKRYGGGIDNCPPTRSQLIDIYNYLPEVSVIVNRLGIIVNHTVAKYDYGDNFLAHDISMSLIGTYADANIPRAYRPLFWKHLQGSISKKTEFITPFVLGGIRHTDFIKVIPLDKGSVLLNIWERKATPLPTPVLLACNYDCVIKSVVVPPGFPSALDPKTLFRQRISDVNIPPDFSAEIISKLNFCAKHQDATLHVNTKHYNGMRRHCIIRPIFSDTIIIKLYPSSPIQDIILGNII